MAGTYAVNPVLQFLDDNGDPLASGQLFTYLAGTSTKVSTYTDVDLTSANTNPIVLDAAGICTVFLAPGVAYKWVLSDSDDTDPPASPLRTRDNLNAVPEAQTQSTVEGTAGHALAINDAVYLSAGDGSRTAGRWYKADADNDYSSSTADSIGFATAAIASGASGSILLTGRLTGLSGLTEGTLYFISATAGGITSSAPANKRAIAVADSTTSLIVGQFQVPNVWTNLPEASASAEGIVTIGTQTFAGAKTFQDRVVLSKEHPLSYDFGDNATSGTGATDVWTDSLPANTLANGETLVVEAFGDQTADSNTKKYTFTIGSTDFTVGNITTSNANWFLRAKITRVSQSVQRALVETTIGSGAGAFAIYIAGTEDLGTTLALKLTLTHATSGTTTARGIRVWVEPPGA